MYGKIILVIVWSLVIIRIKSQPLRVDLDAAQLRKHLDKELHLLDTVVSYYKKINEQSSSKIWNRKGKPAKPDDVEAFALIQVTFFTFWIAVTLRTYSIFKSCICNKEIETEFDLCFNEMTFALNKFKQAIKEYRKGRDQNDGEDFTIETAADEILSLNLDFVSSGNTLQRKKHGKYVTGIIMWDLIPTHILNKTPHKTIFPSCSLIRKLFHEKVSIIGRNILQTSNIYVLHETVEDILEKLKISFLLDNSVEFYEKNWPSIMKDLKSLYKPYYRKEGIFVMFMRIVQDVIDISKVRKLQDFFINSTLGENSQFVKVVLDQRIWILSPSLSALSNIWKNVKKKNYIDEKSKLPTEERIKDVTAIIQSIREVELTIHPNIKRHV